MTGGGTVKVGPTVRRDAWVTVHEVIACPAERAFAYISNYANDVEWRDSVEVMRHDPPGPLREGARISGVIHFFGRVLEIDAEVTAVVPGERIEFRTHEDPLLAWGYRAVQADGSGCRVTYHVEARLGGLMRALSPLVQWSVRRRARQDLLRLRTILERSSAS